MSTMAALKAATWDIHIGLEKRLAVKNRFTDLTAYGEHIARLWAFHAQAESDWAPYLQQGLDDFPLRLKAPLLLQDCRALSLKPALGAPVPSVCDVASALGGFYVLEGASLGGQHLLPIVKAKLGLTEQNGASYLASYRLEVKSMWNYFGAAVESHCQTSEDVERATAAARLTFLALEEWLCELYQNP
jgi:heme oxygenase (biliverdin-IX-beta and delta-forming)